MTARISSATPGSPRLSGTPDTWALIGIYVDGDSLRYARAGTPGQLWERVAERTTTDHSPAYLHTVMHADGREAVGMNRRYPS